MTQLSSFIASKMSSLDKFIIEPVTQDQVKNLIRKLNINKSSGLDEISPKLLRLSSELVTPSLTQIINQSIRMGIFPDELKKAYVVPIYKKGDKYSCNNYRPVSILSCISKLLERLVADQLMCFINRNNVLYENQSGFRKLYSCQSTLIKLTDEWLKHIDNGNMIGTLLIDLSKAFDLVNHKLLLKKLRVYNFSEISLSWFASYLTLRKQTVRIGHSYSKFKDIENGVPQGSILGPILFLLYINDLPLYLSNSISELYADDTTLHTSGNSIESIRNDLVSDLSAVLRWCEENGMMINIDKCKSMLIGSRPKINLNEKDFKLNLQGSEIQTVNCEKILGVYVDQTLSWDQQIDNLCAAISSRISLFGRIKTYLPLISRIAFYNGYILPLIDYCSVVWGNSSEENLNRILKLQKRAARSIMNASYDTPSSFLFKQLEIMPIKVRIFYHKAVSVYKGLHELAPGYICNLFCEAQTFHERKLRSSCSGNLAIPRPHLECFKKSLSYSGPKVWNSLPSDVKSATSLANFKHMLRCHLLK